MKWPSLARLPVAWKIFLSAWLVYGLHFSTDIVREHYPAFTLAESGTLRVDDYLGLHPDLFEIEGRGSFINNNPGASLVGAIPYALFRPLVDRVVKGVNARRAAAGDAPPPSFQDDRPMRVEFFRKVVERGLDIRFGLAAGIIHLLATAPIAAGAVVVMYRLLLSVGFSLRASPWLALLYAFATPVFFRAGFLNHNLLVAHATLVAFALLYRRQAAESRPHRLFAAGLAVGFGLLCDYAGVVPLLALGVYALAKLWAHQKPEAAVRSMAWMIAGACIPVAGLLAYQFWAFGHPLYPAQRYMPATHLSVHGWNGLDWPQLDLLLQNLFDRRFGLFAYGPLLLLGLAAPWVSRRRVARLPRAELWLTFGLAGSLLLFTSMNQFARLQWNTGFRMLAPLVPLLFVCSASVLVRIPRRLAIGVASLATLHGFCLAMVRADAIESVRVVASEGFRLPWLTSVWRASGQYLPVLGDHGPQAWPVVVAGALLLLLIWGPPGSPESPERPHEAEAG